MRVGRLFLLANRLQIVFSTTFHTGFLHTDYTWPYDIETSSGFRSSVRTADSNLRGKEKQRMGGRSKRDRTLGENERNDFSRGIWQLLSKKVGLEGSWQQIFFRK